MRRAAWVLLLVLTACNGLEDLTAIDPSEGAYARPTVVGINYPADALPVGSLIEDFVNAWDSFAESTANVPVLAESSRDGDVVMYVAESAYSGVALDVVATAGVVTIVQLQVVDAAGEGDELAAADTLSQFLMVMGVDAPEELLASLGVIPEDALFLERTGSVVVSGDAPLTVFIASNEDTILLGITG